MPQISDVQFQQMLNQWENLIASLKQTDIYTSKITIEDTESHQVSPIEKGVFDEITLIADPSNAGTIYFGSGNNPLVPLAADGSFTFKKKNLTSIYYQGDTVGDILYVVG